LFLLVSCGKRIKKVEIHVKDIESFNGIAGVNIYIDDKQFQTDVNGIVYLHKEWNYRGKEVRTNIEIKGYTKPNIYQYCKMDNVYKIESELLLIQLERLRIIKLKLNRNSLVDEAVEGCFVLDDLEHCEGQFAKNFKYEKGAFEFPKELRENDGILFRYMAKSPDKWILKLFYNSNGNCEFTSVNPDQIEHITMDPSHDTTYYTVQLK
jgi:hypothetical protein